MYPSSPGPTTPPAPSTETSTASTNDSAIDANKAPDETQQAFIGKVRAQLSTLNGEISYRNSVIETNDSYVYGDYLSRSLKVPAGHDFTPVNWLRRVCEIHRAQTLGDGFTVSSSYHGVDADEAFDPSAKPQLQMINNKMRDNAESRNKLFQAIQRDNGGDSLWANMAENGSAVGFSVLKAWYDKDDGKYRLEMVEAVDNFYAVWSSNDFRHTDFYAYVFQVSKQRAITEFNAPADVVTSPLGMPLSVPTTKGVSQYYSTQPMVTIMEITGKVQGWKTNGHGTLQKCKVGEETKLNAYIVGNQIDQVLDDPKDLPYYYVFPNKLARRRPWGQPDISPSAIAINQTYIETLSDWRTVQSKVNFPKYQVFGFGMDVQLPKPKSRTVEFISMGEGQSITPIQNPNTSSGAEIDFMRTLDELKGAFVRETGVSRQLFDIPDSSVSNSAQAGMLAMKSISDQVETRRQLWSPVIQKVFEDALQCLALWDDNIKELVQQQDDWYIRVEWPPALRKDDPIYQTMKINRLIGGTMSVQTFLESMGENAKEEIDRINDEMDNPITAAIHGKMLSLLAEFKIAGPPTSAPPKVSVNLRGDLTPEQETNLSVMHQFGEGPIYGPSAGPQGELGMRATDDAVNTGRISGQGYQTGQPIVSGGQPVQQPQNGPPVAPSGQSTGSNSGGGAQPTQPQMLTAPGSSQPGQQPVSQAQPGQPATPNSSQGNINQTAQRNTPRKGKK